MFKKKIIRIKIFSTEMQSFQNVLYQRNKKVTFKGSLHSSGFLDIPIECSLNISKILEALNKKMLSYLSMPIAG
jgi:hypothetical protein